MEPASVPHFSKRAVLFSTITSKPPSWHLPSASHEPAIESVIMMICSIGFILKISLRNSGAR